MNKKICKLAKVSIFFTLIMGFFPGCYSVFSGGTGGLVVDAESTSTPKQGIPNVDVYAYVDSDQRDSDFDSWKEGSVFSPSAEYYGHTTTGNNGNFTISKIVWKSFNPDFGKDADYTKIYFIFYHENYGVTKGESVIISDSSTDTVYAELTAIRKTTNLTLNFKDVTTGGFADVPVFVTISVPQKTSENKKAAAKVYKATIFENGTIDVSYPRWASKSDKSAGKENCPEITITYTQSGDEITWKGCYNMDNADNDYAFRTDAETGIKKVIKNDRYSIDFYGKATKINVPAINGQYVSASSSNDDGIIITLMQKDGASYTIDLGQTSTYAQSIGTSGTEKHGVFSGLGTGYTWTDETYTQKYSSIDVKVSGGTKSKELTLRSGIPSYTVQLQ